MPKALNPRLKRVRDNTGRGNSATEQRVLANGHFARHIRRMGPIYYEKCLRASQVISDAYGGPLEPHGTHGGFPFFLGFPDGTDTDRILREACTQDLSLQCRKPHGPYGPKPGAIIGYSSLSLDAIEAHGSKLGRLLRNSGTS